MLSYIEKLLGDDIVSLIKNILPQVMKVRKIKMLNDFEKMDRDLLGERLRHLVLAINGVTRLEWSKEREHKRIGYANDIRKIIKIWQKRNYDTDLLNWARGVLEKFERWGREKKPQIKVYKNFSREKNFWDIIRNRRSTRMWKTKKVPDNVIKKIIDAARWAPSSCNRQPWKFTVVRGDKRKLLEHQLLESAPAVILLSVDERPYFFHEKYAPALDVGFVAQNILLAAYMLKLGACPVYYAHSDAQKIKKQFGIEPHRKVYLAIALGYASEYPDIPARVKVKDLLEMV